MITSTLFEVSRDNYNYDLDMVVDWVQVTFHEFRLYDVLKLFFNCEPCDCTYTKSGLYGYNETYTYSSKIHVMKNSKRSDMGVHIQMSGSACREFEQLCDWYSFFQSCLQYGGVFTRVDIALDCYKKYFTVNQLKNKIKRGELVSKFKKSTYLTQYNIKDGSSHSSTLHFGSMKSSIYIVFYDKLAERKDAGYSVDKKIDFWTRCEIRYKKGLANNVVNAYVLDPEHFGTFIFSSLYYYLDFKEASNDKNKSRWLSAVFWKNFLNHVDKVSISNSAVQSSIQKKMNYAESHLSKLLSMVYAADNDFIRRVINTGIDKISYTDLSIINSYLMSCNKRIITKFELDQMKNLKAEQLDLFKTL